MAYYNDPWRYSHDYNRYPREYDREERDWRDRERERERDRGPWNRATDEVRSWFGDDSAERRRRWDEMRERSREQGRGEYDRDREYFAGPGDYYRSERYGSPAFERGWGPYYGRGPRGYQRSDERIREDVCDRLTDAPDVDASDVDVQVSNAEVTLRGTVSTRAEKRRAEDIVEHVSGVNDVRNEIRVASEKTGVTEIDLTGQRRSTAIGETPEADRTRETPSR